MFTLEKKDIIRPFVKTEHTKEGHFYRTVNGHLYPSITTIFKMLDPKDWYPMWVKSVMKKENLSEADAEKRCKEIGKNSMDVGTALHYLAENHLDNKNDEAYDSDDFEKDPMELFKPLELWLDKNIDIVYATETPLYSDELKLAGTVDCVAKLKDGRTVIIDFKNSRNPKTPGKIKDAHYYEQMCAYGKMWEYCTGEKIDTGIVLVCSWDDKVRAFECKLSDYESLLWDWLIKYEILK